LRPGDAAVWTDLGLGYENDGKLEQAARAYERSIELSPEIPRAYVRLGLVHQSLDHPDSAIAVWRRGATRAPGEFALRFNLALAYARDRRHGLALEEVEAALEIDPESEDAASLRELLRGESGGPDDSP
jgi:tetratricopeptide (TPR) repeat protein